MAQATKTSSAEAAGRKVDRMLMGNSEHQRNQAAKKKAVAARKPMAVKNDRRAKTGSRGRKPDAGGRRTTTMAQRKAIVLKHFKNILSGNAGRMQGNK